MNDIRTIIISPEKEQLPLDMRGGSGDGRVFLEIGFGNGEFLAHLARKHPDDFFWGVEMSRSCVLRSLARIRRENLGNVFLVCGDARFILRECVPRESLDGIYMNFPCPWPKNKHAKRRVSSGGFSAEIANTLKKDAFFELVTDEEWYGIEVRDALAAHPFLELQEWMINPPRSVTTKYERKWLEMGKRIFLSKLVKTGWDSGGDIDCLGRSEDVHVRISGKRPLNRFVKKLYDQGGKKKDSFWVYKRSYDSGDGAHLVEVVSGDDGFEQKFFLQLIEREDDILVKVAPYSSPFLTDSVKWAIEDIASMLESCSCREGEKPNAVGSIPGAASSN